MFKKLTKILFLLTLVTIILSSCSSNDPIPRPKGYFRIDTPEKSYKFYNDDCPFSFDIPVYSFINKEKPQYCWLDILFPNNDAILYLTYLPVVDNNINKHLEDSRELVYKHTVMADAIEETIYVNDSSNVYGVLYDLKGNTASAVQFYLTDSTDHFLRGSLYFNVQPNKDSLAPVIDFIREDVIHLMESFEWK